MGLDMYLYTARRLNDGEMDEMSGKNVGEMYEYGYSVFETNFQSEEEENMYRDILPLCRKITLKTDYVNIKKIAEDNGIEYDHYTMGMWSSNEGYKYYFWKEGDRDNEVSVTVSNEDVEKKYTLTEDVEYYIFDHTEIMYWRKNYELQNKLHELYDGRIENCGYHKVNADMMDAIIEDSPEMVSYETKDVFYHEWY